MLRYLIFIIFGILLFLLLNRNDSFSVGNQYSLDRILDESGDLEDVDPNETILRLLNVIIQDQRICKLNELGECQSVMSQGGGSCQIDTVVGLYYAMNVPFTSDDHNYIESQGIKLRGLKNMDYTFDYLTNRQSMKALLVHNNIVPNSPISPHLNRFNLLHDNTLYPIYLGVGSLPLGFGEFSRTHSNGVNLRLQFGHGLLMYKTDLNGLESFIASVPHLLDLREAGRRRRAILVDLGNASSRLLSLSDGIRANGNVCIMIDFCQKKFYAVTEMNYPSTVELLDDGGTPPTGGDNLDEYNTLWMLKLIIEYQIQFGIVSFNTEDPTLDVLDLTRINVISSDSTVLAIRENWKNNKSLRMACGFWTYVHKTKDPPYRQDYQADTLSLKPSTDFYGKLNISCNNDEPKCNDPSFPDLFCNNVRVNDRNYNVCQNKGDFNTPCKTTEPRCNQDLFCTDGTCQYDLFSLRSLTLYQLDQYFPPGFLLSIDNRLYIYNTNFTGSDIEPKRSLDQLIIHPIYLGYFQKLSSHYSISSVGMWQHRHFFLKWNRDIDGFVLIYAEVIMDRRKLDDFENLANVVVVVPDNNSLLEARTVLEILKTIQLKQESPFFHVGRQNGNKPDNYVTVLFQEGSSREYLEIYSDNSTNTPIAQLKEILTYIQTLQEQRVRPCSA
tara:strand:+ start:25 stop:2028 length:2004 start_codon:yes stop_codon:yes gene_type:complete